MRKISARVVPLILAVFLMQGCAQKTVKEPEPDTPQAENGTVVETTSVGGTSSSPGPEYGPPAAAQGTATPEVQGPAPVAQTGLVLIIPAGLVKGASAAGVLKYMNRMKIKISGIVSTEMGAWMSALYAVSGNSNSMEWQLTQAKKIGENGWKLSDVNELVKKSLKHKEFRETKIPIIILSEEGSYSEGLLSEAVISAFKNTTEKKTPVIQVAIDQLIQTAKKQFPGVPVIVVQTVPEKIGDVDLTIHPQIDRVDDYDFKKISEVIFQGENASALVKNEIIRLSQGVHP